MQENCFSRDTKNDSEGWRGMTFSISDRAIQNFERVFGVFGICILCWMIYRLGPHRIASNLHTIGWSFFLMLILKGLRYFSQTVAWKLILGDEGKKIKFRELFKAILEGESVNYITITKMGGEPLKIYALKDKVALAIAASSVIVLKFCVILGFWLVVSTGFLFILFYSDVTGEIKRNIGMGLVVTTLFLVSAYRLQKFGMFKPLSWILNQFQSKREWLSVQVARLTRLDDHILETYRSKPVRVFFAALSCALIWVEEIFFIWLTLHFLKMEEHWMIPMLIGTIALLANSFFFFVPWHAGTQEGTMVLAFTLLDLSEPAGLSLAILRRLRELIWVFTGLVFFALESMTAKTVST